MPHSLRAKIKGLRYKGIITDKDCDRLRKALDNENVLDKIRAEVNQYGSIWVQYTIKGHTDKDIEDIIEDVLRQAKEQVLSVIDKYRNEVANETDN